MAVAIDIGEAGNIHPKDKWDVGRRLTLIAMAKEYGSAGTIYSGPLYQGMSVQGATVRLAFRYAQGLAARGGGKLAGFEVAGPDGKWAFADATIHGDSVWVGSASVASPVKARYGWANNPVCNLINGAGLRARAWIGGRCLLFAAAETSGAFLNRRHRGRKRPRRSIGPSLFIAFM